MLYRSTDRLCRCGAPMQNLAHSASFESLDKDAPSKAETKHLGPRPARILHYSALAHKRGEQSTRQLRVSHSRLIKEQPTTIWLDRGLPDVRAVYIAECRY